jgi:hypothetical protein
LQTPRLKEKCHLFRMGEEVYCDSQAKIEAQFPTPPRSPVSYGRPFEGMAFAYLKPGWPPDRHLLGRHAHRRDVCVAEASNTQTPGQGWLGGHGPQLSTRTTSMKKPLGRQPDNRIHHLPLRQSQFEGQKWK